MKLLTAIIWFVFLFLLSNCSKEIKSDPSPSSLIISKKSNIHCFFINVSKKHGEIIAIIDSIEYYDGENAYKEFKIDLNKINSNELILTDGFYIRNSKIDSLNFYISDSAEIIMQTYSHDKDGGYNFNEKISQYKFVNIFAGEPAERYRTIPFNCVILDDKLISIQEIYIP